jgi:hypothetical protein
MEGILIEMGSVAPVGGFFAGLILLALATAAILLGYTSEEEKRGERLYWAEWPIPGTEGTTETSFTKREYLKAA